jgi:PKD repeat protein
MKRTIRYSGAVLLALILFSSGLWFSPRRVEAQFSPTPIPINPFPPASGDTLRIAMTSPQFGSTVSGRVSIIGSAIHPQFLQYQILYAPDPNPQNIWYPAGILSQSPVLDNVLGIWDTSSLVSGTYQLRLTVNLRDNTALSTQVTNVRVQNQTALPPTALPNIAPPVAVFTASVVTGNAPLTVQFNNQSYGTIASYQWNFGDGTTSTDPNPSHSFNAPGLYPVTLTVTGPGGQQVQQLVVQVLQPPVPTATLVPAQEQEGTFQVNQSADDVNETNDSFNVTSQTLWLGNAGTTDPTNFTGVRFNGVSIPRGATILSARIEFYNPSFQWINLGLLMYADATGNSLPFDPNNRPSQRPPTSAIVEFQSDERSQENTWIPYGDLTPVIQEIVSRSDWQPGNSLSLILRGQSAGRWGRKFFTSYDGDAAPAPRLVVRYRTP